MFYHPKFPLKEITPSPDNTLRRHGSLDSMFYWEIRAFSWIAPSLMLLLDFPARALISTPLTHPPFASFQFYFVTNVDGDKLIVYA